MKKQTIVIGITGLLLCIGIAWFAFRVADYDFLTQTASPTSIRFKQDTLQLGDIHYGEKREAAFCFTNIGKEPLLVRNVLPACDCTNAIWKKQPISPGHSGEIKITFEPNSLGKFIKDIEVQCNVKEKVIHLKLCGSVIE